MKLFTSTLQNVPPSTHRVAYILDLTDTPELRKVSGKSTVDGYIKFHLFWFIDAIIILQFQDAWTGPTGSTAEKSLAKVVIFDADKPPVLCRRSNLTCSGCYTCLLAADDFLDDCQRWDDSDKLHAHVSAQIMAAKASESESVAAVASA
jgi:hypothetical protein